MKKQLLRIALVASAAVWTMGIGGCFDHDGHGHDHDDARRHDDVHIEVQHDDHDGDHHEDHH